VRRGDLVWGSESWAEKRWEWGAVSQSGNEFQCRIIGKVNLKLLLKEQKDIVPNRTIY
jgi:hypothetical protein